MEICCDEMTPRDYYSGRRRRVLNYRPFVVFLCVFFIFVVLHVWYMLMSQLASEPEQVATSDLERSYDL